MSVNYAEGLSSYDNKGKVDLKEFHDSKEELKEKLDLLAKWVENSTHMVVHTGAGISTSAGIPDFRGPKGVWTLEERGEKPKISLTWEDAIPTPTHMALVALEHKGIVKYCVTQNVDGLHLRSGFPRNRLSFLHGDVFVEECDKCGTQFINLDPVQTMAQRYTGNVCDVVKKGGRACRGKLKDMILDWEADLPEKDIMAAEDNSKMADLNLTLGTSLQIVPAGNLPTLSKKTGGKLVIVSLSKTKHDKKADIRIFARVDEVMEGLMRRLGIDIPKSEIVIPILKSQHPLQDKRPRPNSVVKFYSMIDQLKKEECAEEKEERAEEEERSKRVKIEEAI